MRNFFATKTIKICFTESKAYNKSRRKERQQQKFF